MAKNNTGADKDADKAATTTATGKEKAPLETPISVQDKADQETADKAPAPAEEAPPRPIKAKVPYPHNRMVIPGALTGADGSKVDLVITREWTDVPAEVVRRVKDTARRARVPLSLAVPDNDKEG